MAVEIDLTRKAVQISWCTDKVRGEKVNIRLKNPKDEDISTTEGPNDGLHVVTYPADYSGKTHVLVRGSESGEDHGVIRV